MHFLKLYEKNGDLAIINVDSIHAIYVDGDKCAIDYGNKETIRLDIPIEIVSDKLRYYLLREEVFE
jgi:hypothetical protein